MLFSGRDIGDGTIVEVGLEITDRKRRESHAGLLDRMAKELSRSSDPGEIMQAAGTLIGRHLHLLGCNFCDVNDARGEVTVHRGWTVERVPTLEQTYDLKDFLTDDYAIASREGEPFIVCDTAHDPRTDAEAYARLRIGSFVTIPFLSGGRWIAYLTAMDDAPREWRDDELALLKDVSERLLARVEQARAEMALRESEEKYRALFENMTEGYAIGELLRGASGQAIDWRFIEFNPALERHTGMDRVASTGRWFADLFLGADRTYWLDVYQSVVDTQSVRTFEDYWPPLDRWLGGVASPADEGRFHIMYRDVSERKRSEIALRESEERQKFLLELSDALRPLADPVRFAP